MFLRAAVLGALAVSGYALAFVFAVFSCANLDAEPSECDTVGQPATFSFLAFALTPALAYAVSWFVPWSRDRPLVTGSIAAVAVILIWVRMYAALF